MQSWSVCVCLFLFAVSLPVASELIEEFQPQTQQSQK